ncbi:hypothetical protein [Paenibacillus amylolyticus]|uniref:hypothetical protein n=1 Tax=Paenibacillus amylolyticus TaxID=1451 RepID=UPI003EC0F13F
MSHQIHGVWTYRSFFNITEHVEDFNELRFGQGELVFEIANEQGDLRGQLAFRSAPPRQDDARLSLFGSMENGTPVRIRFQGEGIEETAASGWVYDYVGYLVPNWLDGVNQRKAIVGSVIRTVPHGDRPAGVVGSFIAVHHEFLEPRDVIPLPDKVTDLVAARHHRLHHTIWHSVRNFWLILDDVQRDKIRALDWQPGENLENERPAISEIGTPFTNNGSGEDFLFMHRQMINEVNSLLEEPIRGWPSIPAPGPLVIEPNYQEPNLKLRPPGNPDGFTLPPAWFDPTDETTNRRIMTLKTDEHYWSRMRWWDREFKNPQYLSTLSLGQLGSLIEWTVHNDMHMRWASVPRDPSTGDPISSGRQDEDIDPKWDNPKYDFLGEFYSSHVNPVFWRLHGWVDERINDWFKAHNQSHLGEVESEEIDGVTWFKKGKWVQNAHPWVGPAHSHHDVGKMEEVNKILFNSNQTLRQKLTHRTKKLTWFGSFTND